MNPKNQKNLLIKLWSYPTELGEVDIAAAKDFNRAWKKRNLEAKSKKKNSNDRSDPTADYPRRELRIFLVDLVVVTTKSWRMLIWHWEQIIVCLINAPPRPQ